MKVGTDSIMLGSWIKPKSAKHILDIGTGSGLLAIMLAQKIRSKSKITGLDIDNNAILQAKENAENCPWGKQISFFNTSLQQFQSDTKYDLICSNPPYFEINSTANNKHSTQNRQNARQTIALDHATLLKEVCHHLTEQGKFYCVIPFDVSNAFIQGAASLGLTCSRQLQVQPNQQKNVTRVLLEFSQVGSSQKTEKLCIYDHSNKYSPEYIALCKDYYVNF